MLSNKLKCLCLHATPTKLLSKVSDAGLTFTVTTDTNKRSQSFSQKPFFFFLFQHNISVLLKEQSGADKIPHSCYSPDRQTCLVLTPAALP